MDNSDRRSMDALSTAFPRSPWRRKPRLAQLMTEVFSRSSSEMEIAFTTVTRVK